MRFLSQIDKNFAQPKNTFLLDKFLDDIKQCPLSSGHWLLFICDFDTLHLIFETCLKHLDNTISHEEAEDLTELLLGMVAFDIEYSLVCLGDEDIDNNGCLNEKANAEDYVRRLYTLSAYGMALRDRFIKVDDPSNGFLMDDNITFIFGECTPEKIEEFYQKNYSSLY